MQKTFLQKMALLLICITMVVGMPVFVLAADPPESAAGNNCGSSSAGNKGLCNPLAGKNVSTLPQAIGLVINLMLGIVGSLALAMFVYGGLTWMTSMGNAENVKKGRDVLVWSTIGLVIIFGSYAVVNYILKLGS